MLKNYLIISFRNLRKHFSYSLINIFGLGLGLATCLLLTTWIRHELSFDKFHEKADRIYRFSLEYAYGGQVVETSVSPTALLPAMLTLPETETGVRVVKVSGRNPFIIQHNDKQFQEYKFYAADSTFFDVFSFPLISGNPKTALSEPYSLVLTKTSAKKYFGTEDPIGKMLKVNGTQEYTVTGMVDDIPSNSHFRFDFLASFISLPAAREQPQWWSANYQTFIVLAKNASVESLDKKINDIVKREVAMEEAGSYVKYNAMPLTDIYLRSDLKSEPEVVSDIRYVYIFSAVALLILVIACINYINLATAKAADRAKEVGIRKVVGAVRKQLFVQFIGESVIITLAAFVFGFFLSELLLPLFNQVTGKEFSFAVFLEPSFLTISVGVLLIIALLSGAYPAFAITAFKPVSVLKGNFKASGKGIWLRKSLVVFQFGISIILITGTIIIVKQLNYIQAKNLGFDKENTILLPLDNKTREVFQTLKNEWMRSGAVVNVGRGSESPVTIQAGYSVNVAESTNQGIATAGLLVDEGYLPTVGLEMKDGRNFNENDVKIAEKDTIFSFILNEAALAALYLDESNAIGKKLSMNGRQGEIIGIVKNFHFASLHTGIRPLVIFPEDQYGKIFVRLAPGEVSAQLEKIKSVYGSLVNHRPFEFQFLDQQYQALYTNEQRMSSVFVVFATLAIIIACLGLLGLVAFSASQKTKEIGIRKVLGATPANIMVLITGDFTKLVIIALLIGIPSAYWIMTQWLNDFAYRTDLGFIPVVLATGLCLFIAFASAGYQALKAALLDPAKTLRSE